MQGLFISPLPPSIGSHCPRKWIAFSHSFIPSLSNGLDTMRGTADTLVSKTESPIFRNILPSRGGKYVHEASCIKCYLNTNTDTAKGEYNADFQHPRGLKASRREAYHKHTMSTGVVEMLPGPQLVSSKSMGQDKV